MKPSFDDLCEIPPDDVLAPLDREGTEPENETQAEWMRYGVVLRRGLLPSDLCDAYRDRYLSDLESGATRLQGGYRDTEYESVPEMRELLCHPSIHEVWNEIFPVEMGLHLCLSGFVTTQRAWHQDDYLNPPHVYCWYGAVWIALGDIEPSCGPFEYVPGSHHWPLLRRNKLAQYADRGEMSRPNWPGTTERFVVPACESEIAKREAAIVPFLPARKGDVLFWHGRLLHRGANPQVELKRRPALIGHYSAVDHRPDMPKSLTEHRPGWGKFWKFGFTSTGQRES